MHYITTVLDPNEPCYGLWEGPELSPVPGSKNGHTAYRWLQKVFVVRWMGEEVIAKHITDFGPAENFEKVTPLLLVSQGQDQVAALQWWAEKNRNDDHWYKRSLELVEESTMIADIIEQWDITAEWAKNKTVTGPAITVQRNAIDRTAAYRAYNDKMREKRGYLVK